MTLPASEDLTNAHPMQIRAELVPRAMRLIETQGTPYEFDNGSPYAWTDFKCGDLHIVYDDRKSLRIYFVPSYDDKYAFHHDADGLVLVYEHGPAVKALEILRRHMILDDLADA